MKDIHFRVWHLKDKRMYFRGYQKWLHVLLCDDDHGQNGGQGKPVKRASYGDCIFLESTGLTDKTGREIFEGDLIRVRLKDKIFSGVVGPIPDSFGAGKVHPFRELLKENGITGYPDQLECEILGNEYESLLSH